MGLSASKVALFSPIHISKHSHIHVFTSPDALSQCSTLILGFQLLNSTHILQHSDMKCHEAVPRLLECFGLLGPKAREICHRTKEIRSHVNKDKEAAQGRVINQESYPRDSFGDISDRQYHERVKRNLYKGQLCLCLSKTVQN